MQLAFRFVFLVASALCLYGCGTTVNSTGKKIVESSTPVSLVLFVAADDNNLKQTGDAYLSYDLSLKLGKLFSALELSLPAAFKANGINVSEFLYASKLKSNSQNSIKTYTHHINITPIRMSGSGRYGSTESLNMIFAVSMIERQTRKQIWQGNIGFGQNYILSALAKIDQAAANEFAKAPLSQLKKDGVINYPANDPIIPLK